MSTSFEHSQDYLQGYFHAKLQCQSIYIDGVQRFKRSTLKGTLDVYLKYDAFIISSLETPTKQTPNELEPRMDSRL